MLEHPTGVVIGTTDVDGARSLFEALGFEVASPVVANAPLRLVVPGASTGWIELVDVDDASPGPGPYDVGPYDVSLYATDVRASRARLTEGGWRCGPVGIVRLGPLEMHQMKVDGPDGLRVVLIESNRRRPSVLDVRPDAAHSEVHSVVWCVASLDDSVPFWRDVAGLDEVAMFPIDDPAVVRFLELPDERAPMRMALISGREDRPMRFELMEFTDRSGAVRAAREGQSGVQALVFEARDVEQASAALITNTALSDGRRADRATVIAPGGVRFEIRRSAS